MTDNVTNFLASGIEIKGTIRFQNDMHIDGKIEGEIISDKGKVTIGETAQIKGDITAGDVRIYGNVEGKVTSDRCELKQQARVVGDTVPAPEAELLGASGSSPVLQKADGCRFTQIPSGRKTASFFCPNHRRIPRRRIAACVFY